MTAGENTELRRLNDALFGDGRSDVGLIAKVDSIDRRLDRWDGAISMVRYAASLLGIGGIGLIIAALYNAAPH